MTFQSSGEMKYTDRAYRQDARQAMKNDVTYGLIELITNSDDEYKASGRAGGIEIFVRTSGLPDGYCAEVGVKDAAGGLTAQEMYEAFCSIGSRNKQREAHTDEKVGTRGLFGRGAKDVAAFGKAVFVAHKNDCVSHLELDGVSPRFEFLLKDEPATTAHLKAFGLADGEHGLVASILVRNQQSKALPVPKKLLENLSNHIALRDITARRAVFLSDERTKGKTRIQRHNSGEEVVFSKTVALKGFQEPVQFFLFRLGKYEGGQPDEYSAHGIVVSDTRANYENTFFNLGSRPETGWLAGRIEAPEIAKLATEFDDYESQIERGEIQGEESPKGNPTQIIQRDRSGLAKSHPYYRALAAAISAEVKPILEEIAGEGSAQVSESRELSQRLSKLGRSLGQLVQTALEEAELDDELEGGRAQDEIELAVIPPVQKVAIGETVTLQVWVSESKYSKSEFSVDLIDGFGVVEISEIKSANPRQHSRLPLKVVDIRVKGLRYGSAELAVRHMDNVETAKIVCEPLADFDPQVPGALEWQRDRYRVAPSRSRNLYLLAPASYAGSEVSVSLKDSIADIDQTSIPFKWVKGETHLVAKVRVAAGKLEGATTITASVGEEFSSTSLVIKEVDESSGPEIRFQFDSNTVSPLARSALIPEGNVLTVWIFANHSILRPLLGKHLGAGFEGDNSPEFRSALSEIVATEIANYVLQREQEIHPSRNRDAASLISAQQKLVLRFLRALHLGLLEV